MLIRTALPKSFASTFMSALLSQAAIGRTLTEPYRLRLDLVADASDLLSVLVRQILHVLPLAVGQADDRDVALGKLMTEAFVSGGGLHRDRAQTTVDMCVEPRSSGCGA